MRFFVGVSPWLRVQYKRLYLYVTFAMQLCLILSARRQYQVFSKKILNLMIYGGGLHGFEHHRYG